MPTANENGVYSHETPEAVHHAIEVKPASARIHLIPLEDGAWVYSHEFDFRCGNYSGNWGPAMRLPGYVFPSGRDALAAALKAALRHFDPARLRVADSCVSEQQKRVAREMFALLQKYLAAHCGERLEAAPVSTPAQSGQLSLF